MAGAGGPAPSYAPAKRGGSGHLIGREVAVRLVNGEVIRGTFLDDYRHAIAIRRSADGKVLNIGWDKILYIESGEP
jgi:hypothetical protein